MTPFQPPFVLAIPSAGRASVVTTADLFGYEVPVHFFVPPGEVGEYADTFPTACVHEQNRPGHIASIRNQMLDTLENESVLMVDDDLTGIGVFSRPRLGHHECLELKPIGLVRTLQGCFTSAIAKGAPVYGVAVTDNRVQFNPARPARTPAFLRACLLGFPPGTPLRFDTALRLKEDYDLTLQAWARYGLALRFDYVWTRIGHPKAGGCTYRDPEMEREAIAYLNEKWPTFIKAHPRREYEIVLDFPSSSQSNRK